MGGPPADEQAVVMLSEGLNNWRTLIVHMSTDSRTEYMPSGQGIVQTDTSVRTELIHGRRGEGLVSTGQAADRARITAPAAHIYTITVQYSV